MISKKIENLIKNLKTYKEISKRYKNGLNLEIVRPPNIRHGNYTAQLSHISERKGKMAIGEGLLSEEYTEISEEIRRLPEFSRYFDKVEFAGPIFINFFLSEKYLQSQVKEILDNKGNFGQLEDKKEKIQVEFISANPTGPLTMGNGRGGFRGDVLANILKKAGYRVEREYYVNDTGRQVEILGRSVLGESEEGYQGDYIEDLKKRVKGKNAAAVGEKCARIILEEMIKPTVERMGIKFDVWFSERSLYKEKKVEEVLNDLKKKDLAYEREGALWFKSTQFGDDKDRVLVRSNGDTTYLASDIAYLKDKFDRGFDKIIYFWGADHYGYIARMKAAAEALGFQRDQIHVVMMQLVKLMRGNKEVKMSKRKGIYVTLDEVIDEVGEDAARFFFIMRKPESHMNFDLELAKEKSEKNPVYYVQYAYARMCSILEKLKIKNEKLIITADELKPLTHESEKNLIDKLIRFPEVVEYTARDGDYQVQRLPYYIRELAEAFHVFYRDCRVIGEEVKLQKSRTALLLAAKAVFKEAFDVIGISAPEKM